MFGRVLYTPMNTAAKYLLSDYWWELESIEIRGCIGTKRVMPCLHIHVFIAFSFLCLIFQAPTQFLFLFLLLLFFFIFFITFYDDFIGTAIVKNKRCVFLPSSLNGFCLLWLLLFTVDFLHTKVIWLMFDRVRNLPLIIVTFSTQISLSKLFFLRIKIKREIRVMSSHF